MYIRLSLFLSQIPMNSKEEHLTKSINFIEKLFTLKVNKPEKFLN